jgi:hypothetical protein
MYFFNIRRNFTMADQKSRDAMAYSEELLKLLPKGQSTKQWKYSAYARKPVKLKSKKLAYNYVNVEDSANSIIALSKLEEDTWYTEHDMMHLGWTNDMIDRALMLALLRIDKESMFVRYCKYERSSPSFRSHFKQMPNIKVKQCSVVIKDGSVLITKSNVSDSSLVVADHVTPLMIEGKDFSPVEPSGVYRDKPPDDVPRYNYFKPSPIEFQKGDGMPRPRASKTKPRIKRYKNDLKAQKIGKSRQKRKGKVDHIKNHARPKVRQADVLAPVKKKKKKYRKKKLDASDTSIPPPLSLIEPGDAVVVNNLDSDPVVQELSESDSYECVLKPNPYGKLTYSPWVIAEPRPPDRNIPVIETFTW